MKYLRNIFVTLPSGMDLIQLLSYFDSHRATFPEGEIHIRRREHCRWRAPEPRSLHGIRRTQHRSGWRWDGMEGNGQVNEILILNNLKKHFCPLLRNSKRSPNMLGNPSFKVPRSGDLNLAKYWSKTC